MDKKIFTESELKEMGMQTVDLIHEAIDKGDKERAKRLSRRMYTEWLSMHSQLWRKSASTMCKVMRSRDR